MRKNTLLIGSGEKANELIRLISAVKNSYFNIRAIVELAEESKIEVDRSKDNRYFGIEHLETAIKRHKIKELIIAMDPEQPDALIELIRNGRRFHLPLNILSDLFSVVREKMPTDQFDGLPLTRFRGRWRWNGSFFKRLFDLTIAASFLIILSPIIGLIAALIKITSKGPVFYIDTRMGLNGKPFKMIKFRSMYTNQADEPHREYVSRFIKGDVEENELFKLRNDKRVTPVGGFLRKFSLDEIPQLFNVLLGEMSLVGPRPSMPYEYSQYKDWHKARFETKPGLTGMWQALARSEVPFDTMMALDIYYTYGSHFWLDVELIIRTLRVIILGKGAA